MAPRVIGWRLCGGLALLAMFSGPAQAGFQRMVLAPACSTMAPGGFADVAAYCLDQTQAAPPTGAVLSQAPEAFGNAVVRVGAGPAMTLAAALAQHLIVIEGLGVFRQLRIRNLTQDRLSLCSLTPTVVMGADGATGPDLTAAYGAIARLAGAPDTAASDRAGDPVQVEIWQAVAAGVAATPLPPVSGMPAPTPPLMCADAAHDVAVCYARPAIPPGVSNRSAAP
ncbi:MAG: hypothetical protein P4M00_14905 [Azospirillaceae bacterium]|nr:hypothetical protein [Azospirillaceae bacterium]